MLPELAMPSEVAMRAVNTWASGAGITLGHLRQNGSGEQKDCDQKFANHWVSPCLILFCLTLPFLAAVHGCAGRHPASLITGTVKIFSIVAHII
jgi:hypothetical protein